jgi:quercetin dioxygenase-like cupin family protein
MAQTTDWRGKVIPLAAAVDYSADAIVSKTLLDRKAGTLTLFAFDAGQGLSEHTAPYDATVQILDGEAEIHINREPRVVKAGELIIMPANIPHDVRAARGRFKMLLIMIREKVPATPA